MATVSRTKPDAQPQPFLASRSLQRELSKIGERCEIGEESILFRKGERCEGVFLVIRGKVLLTDGNDTIQRMAGCGSVLGLPATMGKKRYSLTAECKKPAVLGFVARDQFLAFVRNNPDASLEVIRMLADEVRTLRASYL